MQALELKIPPLAVGFIIGMLMWLAKRAVPAFGFEFAGRRVLAMSISVAGILIIAMGVASFRRANTTVNPMKPDTSSTLVVSGIYQKTRNPMYLGGAAVLVGAGLVLRSPAAFGVTILFLLLAHVFVLTYEEPTLESRFGESYRRYKASVNRWIPRRRR